MKQLEGLGRMEESIADTRYSLRVLKRNPVFAAVAIATLTLGIGASTAIFSLVDGILLRPLPFEQPRELVTVWADLSEIDGPKQEWLSYPNYEDARDSGIFEELGAYLEWQTTLTAEGPAQVVQGLQVTHGTLSRVLRVAPMLGRGFLPEDDRHGAPRVTLISHGLWTRFFAADPNVVGRTIVLNEVPHQIVGVMPPGFAAPNLGGAFSTLVRNQEVWRPLQAEANPQLGGRGSALFRTLGRIRGGISVDLARARILDLGERLQNQYPENNTGVTYSLYSLQHNMVQNQATGLWVLLGAVGFILFLVCLNLANLILARGSTRVGEMALRSALGAGRRRLIRQLVTESIVLAVLGGALGFALAFLGTRLFVSLAPAGTPRLDSVAVNGRILIFAALATLGSGVLFGLFPALRASTVNLRQDLGQSQRTSDLGGGSKLRSAMVASQMGVALLLLVGAGLLLKTFSELNRVDLGYDPDGVVAAFIFLNGDRYPEAQDRHNFVDELQSGIGTLPGVEAVGIVSTLPLSGANEDTEFLVEGRPVPPPGQENISWIRRITPGYLDAMEIPVLEGRPFSAADSRDNDARVILVNETMARRYFPGESAVGKRLNFNNPEEPVWREIVGVVKNVKNFGIRTESPNATYFPYSQVPGLGLFLTARTSLTDPESLIPVMRDRLRELDSQLALAQPTTMERMVASSLAQERFVSALLSVFASVALLLATVGLYGVVAYNVSRGMREMGLRIALGADGGRIQRMVVGKSLRLVAAGAALGLVGAVALTRLMRNLLFGVSPTDPFTLVLTTAVLLGTAATASAIPAWRASRVDPARTLTVE